MCVGVTMERDTVDITNGSMVCILKRGGPKIDPWGTPQVILGVLEKLLLKLID